MSLSKPLSTSSFPHASLTKILGEPNAANIRCLKREVYTNLASVKTLLGGGTQGHMGLAMPAADYANLPGTVPWVDPVHPGENPGHAANATNAQITEGNRLHATAINTFLVFHNTSNEIKQQILEAVDSIYLLELQDELIGFASITVATILDHLTTNYGSITQDSLQQNLDDLNADWDPTQPIQSLWNRLAMCQRFATAGADPISDISGIRALTVILEKTGVFTHALKDWHKRPIAEWTLVNFKTDFNLTAKEHGRLATTGNSGYHTANAAGTAAGTIAPTMTEHLNGARAPVLVSPPTTVRVDNLSMYYCWTHGLGTNKTHTSLTCSSKAEGHQDLATVTNMMGGNNKISAGRRRTRGGQNNRNHRANGARTVTNQTEIETAANMEE